MTRRSSKRKYTRPRIQQVDRRTPTSTSGTFDASILRRTLVLLVCVKVVLITLVIDPAANTFEVPKLVASRITAFGLGSATVLATIRYGLGIIPRSAMHLGIGAILMATVVSTLFAQDRYIGLFGEFRSYLGAATVLDMCVLYFGAAIAFRGLHGRTILALALAMSALVAVVYAAVQSAGLDPIAWTEERSGRPSSTFGNPNVLAHFLAVVTSAALAIAVWPPPGMRGGSIRLASATLAVISAAVIVAGVARGGILGVAVGGTVTALLFLRSLTSFRDRVIAFSAVAAVAALLLLGAAATPLADRIAATIQGQQLLDRLLIYGSALGAIAASPVVGHGPDSFAVIYPTYRPAESAEVLSLIHEVSAHSWVLNTAVTTGVLGLCATVSALALHVTLLWRAFPRAHWNAGPLAAASAAYWGTGIVSIGAVAVEWIPWLLFGLTASLGTVEPARLIRSNTAVAALLVAAGLALAMPSVNLLLADHDAGLASAYYRTGDTSAAVLHASSAVARDAGRADHWNLLGLAHSSARDWRSAVRAFTEATTRAPHRSNYWVNLARAQLSDAHATAATDSARRDRVFATAERAVRADPNDPEPYGTLALVANAYGEHDRALAAAETAVRLQPTVTTYDEELSKAAAGASDTVRARRALETVIARRATPTLLIGLVRLDLREGRRDEALSHAERAIRVAETASEEIRLGLVRLFHQAGETDLRDALGPPPALLSAERCGPTCVFMIFDSIVPLAQTATQLDAYEIGGVRLPATAHIAIEGTRTVRIEVSGPGAILSGTELRISGITDELGRSIVPNPTVVSFP